MLKEEIDTANWKTHTCPEGQMCAFHMLVYQQT